VKLTLLYEGSIEDYFRTVFKKQQDPNLPELTGMPVSPKGGLPSQPRRTGTQDTPLTPRHRKYFGAKTNQPTTDKVGFPDQAWSNIRSLSPSSIKVRPYNVNRAH
jgi:hypothetical protein